MVVGGTYATCVLKANPLRVSGYVENLDSSVLVVEIRRAGSTEAYTLREGESVDLSRRASVWTGNVYAVRATGESGLVAVGETTDVAPMYPPQPEQLEPRTSTPRNAPVVLATPFSLLFTIAPGVRYEVGTTDVLLITRASEQEDLAEVRIQNAYNGSDLWVFSGPGAPRGSTAQLGVLPPGAMLGPFTVSKYMSIYARRESSSGLVVVDAANRKRFAASSYRPPAGGSVLDLDDRGTNTINMRPYLSGLYGQSVDARPQGSLTDEDLRVVGEFYKKQKDMDGGMR